MNAPEASLLKRPDNLDPRLFDVIMAILAAGGHILRHWIPQDQQPTPPTEQAQPPYQVPQRFTLHSGTADVDGTDVDGTDVDGTDVDGTDVDGTDLDRMIVRYLYLAGLITLGKMVRAWNTPRQLVITSAGLDVAIARVTAVYRSAADGGPETVPLTTRHGDLVRTLHADPELRIQQWGDRDGWRMGEYPPPRRQDVEPLINTGFLGTIDPGARPVIWRLSDAGAAWATANAPT